MTAIVPAWTGSDTTRSTCSVIEPTMFSAMIGMPTARSSSAATLMSPPMIEPARTSSRARGRSATARTAAAMFSSPTSGIVSTLIRSPRRLWRSASLTAPSATWATCAPPPTTMIRLPKTRSSARVRWTVRTSASAVEGRRPGALSVDALDLELDLGQRRVAVDRGGPSRAPGSGRRARRPRSMTADIADGAVDDVEPDRGGLGRLRRLAASAAASRGRPRRVGGR